MKDIIDFATKQMAETIRQDRCCGGNDPACPAHGIAASNARQNDYWKRVGGHPDAGAMDTDKEPTVRHRFTVDVIVPAKSGDGWNKYPDYSAEEIGRALRRALHTSLEFDSTVEFVNTEKVDE